MRRKISIRINFIVIIIFYCAFIHANDNSKLGVNISAFAQVQYNYYEGKLGESTFKVKRAQLRLFGDIGTDWEYFVQVDTADSNKEYLKDAIIKWKKLPFANITVGQTEVVTIGISFFLFTTIFSQFHQIPPSKQPHQQEYLEKTYITITIP